MIRKKLKNGLTILYEKKPTISVSVVATVKTGSNNENRNVYGISHFIEHMLFEGTKNRKTSTEIANEIEKLGGEFNAYTSNERTSFYIKTLNKHFDIALGIISDIIQNPLFNKKMIEKERRIILKEINMVNDEPRFYQWILFQKTLYKIHPARNPTYGTKECVSKISRSDIINYYKKYYTPNNMAISVVGNVNNAVKKIESKFNNFKIAKPVKQKIIKEPKQTKIQKNTVKRNIMNSYMVLGYKTVKRGNKDSYAFDVIKALLGRGQSGKIIEEIRNKKGLAYEVNVHHEAGKDYGFFAVYLNTHKKNIKEIIKIILKEFEKLRNVSLKELDEAKGYIEGQYFLENEDTYHMADLIGFYDMIGNVNIVKQYMDKIRGTSKKDIMKISKKYFTKNYALAIVEQK